MELEPLLAMMVERGASDLFISPGTPIHIKIDGTIQLALEEAPDAAAVAALADSLLDDEQRQAFAVRPEMNLGRSVANLGRFRINLFRQRGDPAIVVRFLSDHVPSLPELNLPAVLSQLVTRPRGLVLVVGATGSGKSTTLASLIDYRNENSVSHILTVEDPIEYVHHYKRSVVNQREVGIDTLSYSDALKNAMREAPDVILIGEIRDRETMQQAVAYAETGHLCLASLHASNAYQSLQRILTFFPESMHAQVAFDIAHNLTAIVSQRLLNGREGGRLPAVEVLLATPLVRDLVQKGAIDEIRAVMERGQEEGMQTFDQSLYGLYRDGRITQEEALRHAESVSNLNVMIRLNSASGVTHG